MTNRSSTEHLKSLVARVDQLVAEEREADQSRYRSLLLALAKGTGAPGASEIAALLRELGRSAVEFARDAGEIAGLFALAEQARGLPERRAAERDALAALKAGEEEYKRAEEAAKQTLRVLERGREATSRALYHAADAQHDLLVALDLQAQYARAVQRLGEAESQAKSNPDSEELREEAEHKRAEVRALWERALNLEDYRPREAEGDATADPAPEVVVSEGCEWEEHA